MFDRIPKRRGRIALGWTEKGETTPVILVKIHRGAAGKSWG